MKNNPARQTASPRIEAYRPGFASYTTSVIFYIIIGFILYAVSNANWEVLSVLLLGLVGLVYGISRNSVTISGDGLLRKTNLFGLRKRYINLLSLKSAYISTVAEIGKTGKLVSWGRGSIGVRLQDAESNKMDIDVGHTLWRNRRQLAESLYTASVRSNAFHDAASQKLLAHAARLDSQE